MASHIPAFGVLLPRGGIPPIARRRSRLALTLAEREDISRGIPLMERVIAEARTSPKMEASAIYEHLTATAFIGPNSIA